MKTKLLVILVAAFIFSGCYASTLNAVPNENEQSEQYTYMDCNEFSCPDCVYEMYYCFNCHTYHIMVSHFCYRHYNWYRTWYSVHYYHPYAYYHNNYIKHITHRDNSRNYNHNDGHRNSPIRPHGNYVKPPIHQNLDAIRPHQQPKREFPRNNRTSERNDGRK